MVKTIVVTNQKEMDALPTSFDEYTIIQIKAKETIVVRRAYDNSVVEACDSSTIAAYDNSTVEAYNNSTVIAYNNSTVEVWDNSTVEAWDNSTIGVWDSSKVTAFGDSKVTAYDNSKVATWNNSTVIAYNNSVVRAYDNSTIAAHDNSTIESYGNSTIECSGNSKVTAYDNGKVTAFGDSEIIALGNAIVSAYDSSTVSLFLSSHVFVFSSKVTIKKLLDYSTAIFKGVPENIEEKSETAFSRVRPREIEVSFEEWLRRGYVVADGIPRPLKTQKKIGDIEVFECEEFGEKESSYLVKRGETFSHGETVEKAIEDLRYKISDRNLSDFEHWKNDTTKEITIEEAIKGYRVITGACEFGVREFVERQGELPEKISIDEIIKRTEGAYGADSLREFLG